jgi:hypothetical protein
LRAILKNCIIGSMGSSAGTMHDTTPNQHYEDTLFKHWITSFDPKGPQQPPGSEADFIEEYKIQLAALRLRMHSDYGDLQKRSHQQARRIDALEGLVPQVRMQQQQLSDAVCDIRAMKRTLTDLQVDVEKQKRSIFGRITAVCDHVRQAIADF